MPLMQDHELYRRIPGIEARWFVDSVDLKFEAGEIHVYFRHHEMINLHAEPPRSECRVHGVKVVKLAWAEPSSRFTALFEALAIEWLKAASQKALAGLLKLSWDEIHTASWNGRCSVDRWDPYLASVREHLPEADGKIVFDKFHVTKHLGEAVDRVRRKEHKTLKAAGDDRLARTRY